MPYRMRRLRRPPVRCTPRGPRGPIKFLRQVRREEIDEAIRQKKLRADKKITDSLALDATTTARKTVILTFGPGEAGKREQYLGVFGSKNTK